MSTEERKKILEMVADGKISAEEAATLMSALEENAEEEIQVFQPSSQSHDKTESGFGPETSAAAEFDEVRNRARRFAALPLWTGVVLTMLTAWGMFAVQQNSGYTFWFFCLAMPFLLGILLIAIGGASGTSRWVYVNVDRSQQNDWPQHITLAFPLPLGIVSWALQNFGRHGTYMAGGKRLHVDDVLAAIAMAKTVKEPLIVNVDDGDDGERVQVYIG